MIPIDIFFIMGLTLLYVYFLDVFGKSDFDNIIDGIRDYIQQWFEKMPKLQKKKAPAVGAFRVSLAITS